ncbi:hypothetical protein CR513_00791, partial [Mucuna pruriens]
MLETLGRLDLMRSLLPSGASAFEPMMLLSKQKKNQNQKQNQNQNPKATRLLISINVLGSAGPIRFVVNEDDPVASVIDTALKSYAREGRLPILGNNNTAFALYCPHLGSDDLFGNGKVVNCVCLDGAAALSPWERIGSHGVRNFMLCKKPEASTGLADGNGNSTTLPRRGGGSWKAWFNKSLNLKIYSH